MGARMKRREKFMKKIRLFVLLSLVVCALSLFCACNNGSGLATPQDLSIDENYQLSWSKVDGAYSYVVEVLNVESSQKKEYRVAKNYLSLETVDQGDYDLRVKAEGSEKSTVSEWSQSISFKKGYETGCVYKLINNDTEYAIARYGNATGTVYIEDVYRNKPVTEISDRAFKNCSSVEEVHIGKNVRSIGDNAFYGCKSVKKVVVPEQNSLVKIGASAFLSCTALESINIPDGVTTISDSTFAYCRSLKELIIGQGVTYIGEYAFSDCSTIENVVIPNSVTQMGESAFAGCSALKSVTIGSGLVEIPKSAFYTCSALETIVFSENGALTTIGANAFSDCISLKSVTLPEGLVNIEKWAFIMRPDEIQDENGNAVADFKSELSTVVIPSTVEHIGINAFYGAKFYVDSAKAGDEFIYVDNWLVSVSIATLASLDHIKVDTFKENIVGIADNALQGCALLETIELPYSIKYIGDYAFSQCLKLRSIETYNNSVKSIGKYAFSGCKILSTVILSEGLEKIDDYAFEKCERLDNSEGNILCPNSLKSLGQKAFFNTRLWTKADQFGVIYADKWAVGYNEKISTVDLREDVVGIADYAFSYCDGLRSFIVPNNNSLKYIGKGAFFYCKNLDMPDFGSTSVREIGDYAFYYCTSMSEIGLPMRLTRIGRSAFYYCSELSRINLNGKKVTEIGDYAFYKCINLGSISFGNELKTIGMGAFYECYALKEIALPSTVTEIGDYAFFKCIGMTDISLGSGLTSIGNSTFAYCISIKKVDLGANVKSVGDYAFYGAQEMMILKLNEGIKEIGDYAFLGAKKLISLEIPSTLEKIGAHAFHGCKSIESIIIPSMLKEMGMHAFYGCDSLTVYAQSSATPSLWSEYWNSTFRPVIWGCALSDDGKYIVSVVAGENTLVNEWVESGVVAPTRVGYEFDGWSSIENGAKEYELTEIASVPAGTTLYAVWIEK